MVGTLFTSLINDKFSFDIVVHPDFRGLGIGSELAKYGLQEFKDLKFDIPEIELQLDVVNPQMRKILEKMGLEVIG